MRSVDAPDTDTYTLIEARQPPPVFSDPGHTMVEYAFLLAHNASDVIGLAGSDVLSWASGLNWARIVIAALALISLRMGIWAFKGR